MFSFIFIAVVSIIIIIIIIVLNFKRSFDNIYTAVMNQMDCFVLLMYDLAFIMINSDIS